MMECNRDEALRALEIAEKKFTTKDIGGAKKFALKAQNLFPALDGINQLISTLDIYLASETKINGEKDWYSILSLNPSADEDTLKKQYRKLALQLHPDKNKSIGAEGAFQLVSEAWSVLSDKSKKSIYDQKRKISQSNSNNGFYNFAKNAASNKKSRKSSTSASAQPNTFWTSCNRCKMQYEYLRVYLNHNLLCPNCHEAFLAVETGFPCNGMGSNFSWSVPQNQHKKPNSHHGHGSNFDSFNNPNFQWGPFSKTAAQAANMVQQTYEKVKREREEAQAAAKREEALRRKNSSSKYYNVPKAGAEIEKADVNKMRYSSKYYNAPKVDDQTEKADANKMRMSSRINKLNREMPHIDKKSLLMEKAKRELSKKLEEWNAARAANSKEKANTNTKPKLKQKGNGCNVKVPTKHVSIVVPDPEFHDFDKDRTEKSLEGEQVWATYDNDDGMPRFYVLVQKVVSLRPFKLRMSFLSTKSNTELGPMNWVGSGFSKTCGYFRVSRYHINDTINIFSHRVRFEKGTRGIIRIFPGKGETWALYKNWSRDWSQLTPDNVIHKYEIVEVIDDYNEEQGVLVTPLVKVAGFRAVFHRHLDPNEMKRISREEMFRFSHQVPSYLLTGDEAHNSPKGCIELDPAAIPSDLLKVITEFTKEDDEKKTTS